MPAAAGHAPLRADRTTIENEPVGIWPFLGSDRLSAPIAEYEPDLVVHGHAHAGTFGGAIERVAVHNVSAPLIQREFWIFELDPHARRGSPIR